MYKLQIISKEPQKYMQAFEVKIDHYETTNNKVVFTLEVRDLATQATKVSHLRYSEFKENHDEIEQVVSKLRLNIVLPQFPGRKVFGSTSKSEEATKGRMHDLQNYVRDLLAIEKLRTLDIMKQYYVPKEGRPVPKKKEEINIQICIDRYTLVDDKVHYYVRLRDLNSHEEWTFRARYSELRSVHDSLLESKVKNLPVFPKKKFLGVTNESPEDIESRREQLQKYFNEIFDVREILESQAIRFFIQQSKKQAAKEKELEALRRQKKQM